jgi:hypothetical protein
VSYLDHRIVSETCGPANIVDYSPHQSPTGPECPPPWFRTLLHTLRQPGRAHAAFDAPLVVQLLS